MNVISKNLLVNYTRQGKGTTILMLHGWGDQLHTFDSLADGLSEKYEVVRLDLAGFGKSQAPTSAWGVDDYVDYVAEFIKKIDIEPTILIGHSNGGSIAIRGVAETKLQPKRLVLLASAGIRNNQKSRKSTLNIIAKAGKIPAKILPRSTQSVLRQKFYKSIGSDITVAPHMEDTFKRIVLQDIQADAASITIPTLILYGTEDQATPSSYGETFHRLIAGSKLILIESADHFAHQSHSSKIETAINEFTS